VGVHPFMDWTAAERKVLNGYKPSRARRQLPSMAALQTDAKFGSSVRVSATSGGLTAEQGPAIRQQGNCGSCWAISAVEAVEAYLQTQGTDVQLAAQALVDCVPNPQHCGGSGGCDGATGELAYQFMMDHGIPTEADDQYTAQTGTCPQKFDTEPTWTTTGGKRARLSGFSNLPSNKAEPLKQALMNGPVVVAVDGNDWFDYNGGVFDGCQRDAIIGHAVLAKGFGEDSGNKYWLIQNSWGSQWGERGHIRLKRTDDDDNLCGTDTKPQEGLGCDGGPPSVTVCGMCGVLYDPIVPTGVRLEDGTDATRPDGSELHPSFTPWRPTDSATNVESDANRNMKALLGISLLHTGQK